MFLPPDHYLQTARMIRPGNRHRNHIQPRPESLFYQYDAVYNRLSLKKFNVDDTAAGYALIPKAFIDSVGPCAWTRAPYKGAGLNMRALRIKKRL